MALGANGPNPRATHLSISVGLVHCWCIFFFIDRWQRFLPRLERCAVEAQFWSGSRRRHRRLCERVASEAAALSSRGNINFPINMHSQL